INLFSIFSSTNILLIDHERVLYAELLVSGLALGLGLWVFAAFFGRLFYKPYQLTIGQHILCGFLAVLLTPSIPTIYASAAYLKPSLAAMILNWRDSLVQNKAWNDQQFKRQYYEIKKLGLEDFTTYPAPEQGGKLIPLTKLESRIKSSQIISDDAIENFNLNFPFISTVIGATQNVSAEKVNKDVNEYLNLHPGTAYPIDRGVQLAVMQISTELETQISHVILLIRLLLIFKIIIWYGICFGWIAYDSLKKIQIHSSHSSVSKNS
ncbi:MAG: hypothetical protein D0530_05015, partial [Methylococcales bacterium]